MLSGLTTWNEAFESMTDSEAVQRMKETLTKTIFDFQEAGWGRSSKNVKDSE